jgi:hypothetical protein
VEFEVGRKRVGWCYDSQPWHICRVRLYFTDVWLVVARRLAIAMHQKRVCYWLSDAVGQLIVDGQGRRSPLWSDRSRSANV